MKKTKISIIVPVYNVEQYIKRCIDALLDQSFEDYEIIVVNDGTPDNSMDYVESLLHTTDKIIVCNRENGGLSAARNTGIFQAEGEYLFFCDSDDAIEKNCLPRLYEEAHSHNLDMLLFDSEVIPEGEGVEDIMHDASGRKGISTNIMTGMELLAELIQKEKYAASACSYLIKRDFLLNNHIGFYEGILHEDELFTPMVMVKAHRVMHRNWIVYKRYVHLGSISTSESYRTRMEGMAIVVKELFAFGDCSVHDSWAKKAYESNVKNLVREFLGQTAKLKDPSCVLKKNVREIRRLVNHKKWRLGLKFELYIIYLKLQKQLR